MIQPHTLPIVLAVSIGCNATFPTHPTILSAPAPILPAHIQAAPSGEAFHISS